MGKGLGSVSGKTCKGLALDRVDRPNAKRVKGINPSGAEANQFGGTRFPTVIEQYNRDSDYSRWRHGQQFAGTIAQGYSAHTVGLKARFMIGDRVHVAPSALQLFPSKSSADSSWTSGRRMRGSCVSQKPFERSRVTFQQNPDDPSQDRLIFEIHDEFKDDDLLMRHLQLLVGDQIEDSFRGPSFDQRIQDDTGSTALTLLEVNPETKTLVFDLSKPQGRVLLNNNVRWSKLRYDPGEPTIWREGFYLGTSLKFHCGCPDYSGSLTANTQGTSNASIGRRFPVPSAQRTVGSEYEKEMVGFEKRWRDLPERVDERRECKHIHCMRWGTKTPWLEPSDIPVMGNEEMIHGGSDMADSNVFDGKYAEYLRHRVIDWQQTVQAACGAMGFATTLTGSMADRTDRPQLWILEEAPMPEHCRQNDYWLQRGTKNLFLWMEGQGWVSTLKDEEGVDQPIISYATKEEASEFLQGA